MKLLLESIHPVHVALEVVVAEQARKIVRLVDEMLHAVLVVAAAYLGVNVVEQVVLDLLGAVAVQADALEARIRLAALVVLDDLVAHGLPAEDGRLTHVEPGADLRHSGFFAV